MQGCFLQALRRGLFSTLVLLVGGGWVINADAHPHSWVDYTQRIQFDTEGRVTALIQQWKLDPIYSTSLFESLGIRPGRAPTDQQKRTLAKNVAENLQEENYLTHLRQGKQPIAFDKAKEYSADIDDHRLVFTFTLPLAQPLVLNEPLHVQVFDDSYFVEFLYDDQVSHALTLLNAPASCHHDIRHANPTPAQLARASAIDINGKAPDGLGKVFTDTGVVTCRG